MDGQVPILRISDVVHVAVRLKINSTQCVYVRASKISKKSSRFLVSVACQTGTLFPLLHIYISAGVHNMPYFIHLSYVWDLHTVLDMVTIMRWS